MKIAIIAGVCLLARLAAGAERPPAPFDNVRPVLEAFRDQLPPALHARDEASWNLWSRRRNDEIRARLERGEIDSMINLLLFGTSFTTQPRIQFESLAESSRKGLLRARVQDLLKGIRSPGENERLVFLRDLIRRQNLDPDGDDGNTGLFVYRNLQRVLEENSRFAQRARENGRAPLFADRGVSLDATILPNYAVEAALGELKARGLKRVARAAVIGPGLDFTDKESGYDYYPQQTFQPFALYDSLARLGLANAGGAGLGVTVFDISRRVLDHLGRIREQAPRGRGYVIQLPLDSMQAWKGEVAEYWREFGTGAGKSVTPIRPPAGLAALETRAVEIRPDVVLACEPVDLNIVLDRVNSSETQRFDLIVATNILVYYDRFEQALALENISTLLKPGGILLSNDELTEIPQVRMRRVGETTVKYTERLGDSVFWYRRE